MENEEILKRIIYLIFNDGKIDNRDRSLRKLGKLFHLNKEAIIKYKREAFEEFSDLRKQEELSIKEKIKKFHIQGESLFEEAIGDKQINSYGKLMLTFSLSQLIYIFETLMESTKNK